jgi:deazaflavin-dependent oxidoreductase (nitroreductase family)
MAKSYRLTPLRRVANVVMRLLLPLGLAPRATMLLTVPGRRSGTPRSTPVTLVEEDGQRWLVAPYGAVGWVHNARAAGQLELSRGRHSETVRLKELAPEAAAPIPQSLRGTGPHHPALFRRHPGCTACRIRRRGLQASGLPGRSIDGLSP